MIFITAMTEGKLRRRSPPVARHDVPHRFVRRRHAGVPKVEVVGRSKDKVEEIFWDTITQVRADLAGIRRK